MSITSILFTCLSGGDPVTDLSSTAGSTDLLVTWLYKLTIDKQYYNIGAVIGILTFIILAMGRFLHTATVSHIKKKGDSKHGSRKIQSAKRKRFINNTIVHVSTGHFGVDLGIPDFMGSTDKLPCRKGLLCFHVSSHRVFTLDNYMKLFTDTSILNFPQDVREYPVHRDLFLHSVATFYVLAVSYCLSRLKFKLRKPYMNMAMILGLFPGIHVHGCGVLYS